MTKYQTSTLEHRYAQRFEVAVKVILDSDKGTTLYDEKEVHFLRRVRHRNVVRFFGAGQRISDKNLFIVMEFMDAGSLDSFLANFISEHVV